MPEPQYTPAPAASEIPATDARRQVRRRTGKLPSSSSTEVLGRLRPGDVAGNPVRRFDVAAETFGRTGVQQGSDSSGHPVRRSASAARRHTGPRGHRHIAGRRLRHIGVQRAAGGPPAARPPSRSDAGESRRGEHPPRAGRTRPVPVVVRDDRDPAEGPSGVRRPRRPARWAAGAVPAGDAVIGKLILQRDVHRAGDVALPVNGAAVGFAQLPAHIEDRHRFPGRQPAISSSAVISTSERGVIVTLAGG